MNTSEFDFSLVLQGHELTEEIENALFSAGCDDATLSLQQGALHLHFSREAGSLKDAILSAIRDVRAAGLEVVRVDGTHLVTMAEIARRIERTRQMVYQYMIGKRGPGGFPAPVCNLTHGSPLWQWRAVAHWLASIDLVRPELGEQAEVIETVNTALDMAQQRHRNPKLSREIYSCIK